jgi:ATP-dependent RNA helicase DeaD
MTLAEPITESEREVTGFAALRLGEHVLRALEEIGYSDPTPVQAATYPLAVAGRDIIVQARTGTGKTAAFGIPLVDKLVNNEPGVQALVLAPTRELALQSQREIARLGQHKRLHVVAVYGGAPMGKQIDELRSGAQIVSGTPGRVLDHLRRGTLDASRLRVLILDEMDEMLSMGFAKELNAILELIPDRHKRQTMCFSATVDGEVRRHAERHMNEPEMVSLSSDAVGVEQISHYAYMVTGHDRTGDIVRIIEVEDPESAIIFCNMRSETERVAGSLKAAGFNADWLNGDLPQKDRERIMEETRSGKLRYLVATDVAARGIDISHLTHVVNYTFPESAAVYVHRTGRTGRAGRTGTAISLVSPDELGRLYYLRLEYKLSPIERSLPTRGELNTRAEIDRIQLLDGAFAKSPSTTDLAVARRLLTHPDVERILAGLLHTFFGTHDEVDEEAAAARRTRAPKAVEPALPRPPERRPRDDVRPRARAPEGRARAAGSERDDARPSGAGRDEARSGAGRDEQRSGPRRDEQRSGPAREGQRSAAGRDEQRSAGGRDEQSPAAGRDEPGAGRDEARPREAGHLREAGRGREGGRLRDAPRASRGGPRRDDAREPLAVGGERGAGDERELEPRRPAAAAGFGAEPALDGALLPDDERQTGLSTGDTELTRNGSSDSPLARDESRPEGVGRSRRRRRSRDRGPADPNRPQRDESDRSSSTSEPAAAAADSADAADGGNDIESIWGDQPAASAAEQARLSGILYLNMGKRDGVRVSEVAKLLRDSCALTRSEVGRIRVRDRYTFVDVPDERLPFIIDTLSGREFHERTLAPERAKAAASTAAAPSEEGSE